jgi:hypothetical protein
MSDVDIVHSIGLLFLGLAGLGAAKSFCGEGYALDAWRIALIAWVLLALTVSVKLAGI